MALISSLKGNHELRFKLQSQRILIKHQPLVQSPSTPKSSKKHLHRNTKTREYLTHPYPIRMSNNPTRSGADFVWDEYSSEAKWD
ncbi:hypothetical protein Ahy_A05g022832 isoform C [Arachis hypogaea]|uniref:Uncharacterized protein n=1 Tax=Arachis hypogaea TaxID=3818 RepID=A0A445D1P2_ARAHY|nr:hypothetical protein Ahy_A05g022832 isoform C [Arachis hypogaea]